MIDICADFEDIAPEWDALADRAGASPLLRPGWFRVWLATFGRGELQLLTVRREGRLVGLLPLERRGRRLLSPTNAESSEFGSIAEDHDAARELLESALGSSADVIALDFLADDGRDLAELRDAATGHSRRTVERVRERSPYISLEGTFENYVRGLPAKRMADLNRRRRRLSEQGEVGVDIADGRDRLSELLADGYRLESSGWKTEQESAIESRPQLRRLYDGVAVWAAGRGSLRLSFLRIEDKAIAFQFGLEEGGAYYFFKGGYDPAYQRFAPGKLLVEELLKRAFARGLRTFEFLGGDEAWKLEWTSLTRERRLFLAFGPGMAGRAAFAAEAYGRPAARRLGAGGLRALLRR